jgi:hypothetical protein
MPLQECIDFVRHVRDGRSAYHHHKEQMAFGAATLYIAGTTALLFTDTPFWGDGAGEVAPWVAAVGIGLVSIFWFCFIYWQFENRRRAANMVRACDHLLSRWATSGTVPPNAKDTGLEKYGNEFWPKFLVDELKTQGSEDAFNLNIRQSDAWVCCIMIVWGALVIVRIAS